MPYVVCVSKQSPCCVLPVTVPSAALCIRSLEVYGCTPDLTQGEKGCCCQGTTTPLGCCCLFTVPVGTSSITVELWGGGGGGPATNNSDCCGQNPGGGGATWVRSTFPVAAGDQITICAAAGGCNGGGINHTSNWCCNGGQGNCSFVMRNGNICADAWGGRTGTAQCYWMCGCMARACGSPFSQGSPTGDCGCNFGCTGYMRSADFPNQYFTMAAPTSSMVPGCGGQCNRQMSYAGAAPWAGDTTWNTYACSCWNYYRFNTSCTNSAGVAGMGGDNPGQLTLTVTATAAGTNLFTINTSNTSLIPIGTQVYFAGAVFGGVVAETAYYVVNIPSGNTFSVSSTRTGAAITLSTASGTMSMFSRNESVSMLNAPGTAGYACSTSGFDGCNRHMHARPGNFPGGGGASSMVSSGQNCSSNGGIGAPGYVRIYY